MSSFWDVVGKIFDVIFDNDSTESSSSQRPPTSSLPTPDSKKAYRPSIDSKRTTIRRIEFNDQNTDTKWDPGQDIKDLVDALTGAPLTKVSQLFQCRRCKVFYQLHSYEVIRSENGGRCVSCLNTDIVNVSGLENQRGRNATVSAITLQNYHAHVGRVITFEGTVHNVLRSRRGTDYAVMFENRSWTYGMKMVVFRGDVGRIGGPSFLFNLKNKRIQVRGLLVKHERFGHEIIVSDKSMIGVIS